MRSLIIFFATGIYSGYAPIAPGTAGSVVGLVVVWLVFGPLWLHSPALCLLVFAIAFAIACWISDRAEKIFDNHDDSRIVIDEVLGMAATMFGNPITFRLDDGRIPAVSNRRRGQAVAGELDRSPHAQRRGRDAR